MCSSIHMYTHTHDTPVNTLTQSVFFCWFICINNRVRCMMNVYLCRGSIKRQITLVVKLNRFRLYSTRCECGVCLLVHSYWPCSRRYFFLSLCLLLVFTFSHTLFISVLLSYYFTFFHITSHRIAYIQTHMCIT